VKLQTIKKALITGATSDLALHLASALAKHGTHLILCGKSRSGLLEIAQHLKKKTTVTTLIGDLRDPSHREEITNCIESELPDLIVNNAGIGLYGPALMHTTKEQLDILDINAKALLELTLEGARALMNAQKPGIILNISSAASFFTYPTFSVYAASKAFVTNFSVGFDQEMREYGIRVLCSCPGQIETGFRIKAAKNFPQRRVKQALHPSKATRLILKQIKKEKTLSVIDWRYRFALFAAKWLVPKAFIQSQLKRSIRDRYPKNSAKRDLKVNR